MRPLLHEAATNIEQLLALDAKAKTGRRCDTMNAKRTRYLLRVALLLAIYPIAYGSPESGKASVVSSKEKKAREKPRGTTIIKTRDALRAFLKSKPTKMELNRRLGLASSEPQYPESLTFEVSIKGEKPTRIICFITDGRLTEWAWMDGDGGSRK